MNTTFETEAAARAAISPAAAHLLKVRQMPCGRYEVAINLDGIKRRTPAEEAARERRMMARYS